MTKAVEVLNKQATLLQQRIPNLSTKDALILSQASLHLPVDDERQPAGSYKIAFNLFHNVDSLESIMSIDDYTEQMLFRWFINTNSGALRQRLDKLAMNQ